MNLVNKYFNNVQHNLGDVWGCCAFKQLSSVYTKNNNNVTGTDRWALAYSHLKRKARLEL